MTAWLIHWLNAGGYWTIAALMALENIIPPIPSELIMGIGGIRVAQGRMEIVPLMIAGTLGSTAGNYAWFLVGRHFGVERLEGFVRRHGRWLTVEWADVQWMNRKFLKHGAWIVFVIRFMPVGRTIVSLPAGLFGMGHVRFLLWTAAGVAIWNGLLVWAGYALGANFREIDAYIGPVTGVIVVVIAVLFVGRLVLRKPEGGAVD